MAYLSLLLGTKMLMFEFKVVDAVQNLVTKKVIVNSVRRRDDNISIL